VRLADPIELHDLVEVGVGAVRGQQHPLRVRVVDRRRADAQPERRHGQLVGAQVLVDPAADDGGALGQLAARVLLLARGHDPAEAEAEDDHRTDGQRDHAVEDLRPQRHRPLVLPAEPGPGQRPRGEDLHQQRLGDAVQRLLQGAGGGFAGVGLEHAGAPAVEDGDADDGPEPGRRQRDPEPPPDEAADGDALEHGDEHRRRMTDLPADHAGCDRRRERRPGGPGDDGHAQDDHHVEPHRQPRRQRRSGDVHPQAEQPGDDRQRQLPRRLAPSRARRVLSRHRHPSSGRARAPR
jgi:hypothetical protein